MNAKHLKTTIAKILAICILLTGCLEPPKTKPYHYYARDIQLMNALRFGDPTRIDKDTKGLDNILAKEVIRFGDLQGENIKKAAEYYKNTINHLKNNKKMEIELKKMGIDIHQANIENLEKINLRNFLMLVHTIKTSNRDTSRTCYTEAETRHIICFFGSYTNREYYRPLNHGWKSHADIFFEYERIIQKAKKLAKGLLESNYDIICKYDDSRLWFHNDNTSIPNSIANIYICKNCKSGYKALIGGEKHLGTQMKIMMKKLTMTIQ